MQTQIQSNKVPIPRAVREGEKLLAAMYAGELPRERLARLGPQALKDQELLALALGTGYRGRHVLELAEGILADYPVESLMDMDSGQLSQIKGLGKAKAGVLVAAFELARRGLHKGLGVRPVIRSPLDILHITAALRYQGPAARALSLSVSQRPQSGDPQGSRVDRQSVLLVLCTRAKSSSQRCRRRRPAWS